MNHLIMTKENIKDYLIPVEDTLFYDVNKAQQQCAHKDEHLDHAGAAQLAEIDCPGVHKDHFHIKQHKEDSHQEVLDRNRRTGIAYYLNTRFKWCYLISSDTFRPYFVCYKHSGYHKTYGHQHLKK